MSPFEVLNGREPRIPSDLENICSERDTFTIDFKNRWEKAHDQIEKVNIQRKAKFDERFKEKIINIGDSVRLDAPATKLGIKTKIRGDLWSGPFKVIGKLDNGNLKLNIGKPYIVHPDRVKQAELQFESLPMDKKKIHPPKQVRFSEYVEEI